MPRAKKWIPSSSYLELYKDPRWQKKRLEVMERDEFKCRTCGDHESTLNVHHCYYSDGKSPWEYESSSLVTLCEECHLEEKELLKQERKTLLELIGILGFRAGDINHLMCNIHDNCRKFKSPKDFVGVLWFVMKDYLKTERKHG